jgi:hypothetical protein
MLKTALFAVIIAPSKGRMSVAWDVSCKSFKLGISGRESAPIPL